MTDKKPLLVTGDFRIKTLKITLTRVPISSNFLKCFPIVRDLLRKFLKSHNLQLTFNQLIINIGMNRKPILKMNGRRKNVQAFRCLRVAGLEMGMNYIRKQTQIKIESTLGRYAQCIGHSNQNYKLRGFKSVIN